MTADLEVDGRGGKKWCMGGTLHKKSALEWQGSAPEDKLATCSDFVALMWEKEKFVPAIQTAIKNVEDMKPYAQTLVTYLDQATKKYDDPADNTRMYANQDVSKMAAIGMLMMMWLKRDSDGQE